MGENDQKEVFFNEYCEKCVHRNLEEYEDPCHECLSNPSDTYSHKPLYFKES